MAIVREKEAGTMEQLIVTPLRPIELILGKAIPFFMLSGFVFSISNMPVVVRWLTYLNPLRYLLVIIRGIFFQARE